MLSRKLQAAAVIVNSDRVKAGIEAQRRHQADTLILDDGFQQWGLKKDLEIVTIDAANPFGNGWLIPRGILREPLSALQRADIFVLANSTACRDIGALKARLAVHNPSGLIVSARHKPEGFYALADVSKDCGLERVRDKAVALVSGIGNPASFRRVVEDLQIRVAAAFVFPDHHRYSPADMASVTKACRQQGIGAIITTEKDAGKLTAIAAGTEKPDIFVLRISLEIIENEEQFYRRLRSVYSA
jgi:tetraacyldisaccharide 4'-kinase